VCVFVLWTLCLQGKMHDYYIWPFAKKLYHSWISTMASLNEISWKLPPPPRNEELVAPLLLVVKLIYVWVNSSAQKAGMLYHITAISNLFQYFNDFSVKVLTPLYCTSFADNTWCGETVYIYILLTERLRQKHPECNMCGYGIVCFGYKA